MERRVEYGAGAPVDRSALRASWSWAETGVFINTTSETILVDVTGTHWLYKNGLSFSRGRFPAPAQK